MCLSGALSRALCLIHRLRSSSSSSAGQGMGGGSAAPMHAAASGGGGMRCMPRILCLVGSPDVPLQYIPVMNAIFSAQRAEVAVDTLMLGPPGMDSAFLQQAAHLTGGLYLHLNSRAGTAGGGPVGTGAGASTGGVQQHQGRASASSQQVQPATAGGALQCMLTCLSADTATRAMLRVHVPLGVDLRASCFCHKRPVDLGFVCSVCLSIFCQPAKECAICGASFHAGEPGAGAGKQRVMAAQGLG